MKNVAVLHHAGSISRIQRSVEFARQHDAIILISLRHADVDIARRCGIAVIVCGEAVDTVGEAVLALDEIRKNKITDLYISTEQGHLFRAWIISVILHLFTNVTVRRIPNPVDDGYRSPHLRTIRDICRAFWHTMTHF